MSNFCTSSIFLLCIISTVYCGIVSDVLNFGSSKQRLIIKGKLMCGNVPSVKTNIKLVDLDLGIDDEMARTVTDQNGQFVLDGVNEERTPIDGVMKIYHDCDDWLPCQRRWKMKIPSQYIIYVDSKNANLTTLDIGTWNLEVRLHDEDRDCYH